MIRYCTETLVSDELYHSQCVCIYRFLVSVCVCVWFFACNESVGELGDNLNCRGQLSKNTNLCCLSLSLFPQNLITLPTFLSPSPTSFTLSLSL